MATKRSNLPRPTDSNIRHTPERVRGTPNGGHAWKCHYCGEYASSETQQGLFVCRRHGGVTPRQRAGKARPPGRPMTTGKDSRSRMRTFEEILADYEQMRVDADVTDEDFLHLRASLVQAIRARAAEEEVAQALEDLARAARSLCSPAMIATPVAKESLLHFLAELRLFRITLRDTSTLYKRFLRHTKRIEDALARFIRLAKVRSDIEHDNEGAHQLLIFAAVLRAVLEAAAQRLSEENLHLLTSRIHREFGQLPNRVLEPNTLIRTVTLQDTFCFYQSGAEPDPFLATVNQLKEEIVDLDDTTHDMLSIRASLASVRQLFSTVRETARILEALLENLECSIDKEEVEAALREREQWTSLQHLMKHARHFHACLDSFDQTIEAKHERIVLLTYTRQRQRRKLDASEKIGLFPLMLEQLKHLLLDVLGPDNYVHVQESINGTLIGVHN